jgi:hypothetical protein
MRLWTVYKTLRTGRLLNGGTGWKLSFAVGLTHFTDVTAKPNVVGQVSVNASIYPLGVWENILVGGSAAETVRMGWLWRSTAVWRRNYTHPLEIGERLDRSVGSTHTSVDAELERFITKSDTKRKKSVVDSVANQIAKRWAADDARMDTARRELFDVIVWPPTDVGDSIQAIRLAHYDRVLAVKEAITKGAANKTWSTHFDTDWGLRWDNRRQVWVSSEGLSIDGEQMREYALPNAPPGRG